MLGPGDLLVFQVERLTCESGGCAQNTCVRLLMSALIGLFPWLQHVEQFCGDHCYMISSGIASAKNRHVFLAGRFQKCGCPSFRFPLKTTPQIGIPLRPPPPRHQDQAHLGGWVHQLVSIWAAQR